MLSQINFNGTDGVAVGGIRKVDGIIGISCRVDVGGSVDVGIVHDYSGHSQGNLSDGLSRL